MRLIDADALIQKRNHAKNYSPDMYVIGQGYVMDAPTIDAVPVVRGEWISIPEHENKRCSVCNIVFSDSTLGYFCPNCGAKIGDKP